MGYMKDIIKRADEFAISEIKKYGVPSMINYDISNKKGLELSKQFDVDQDIVQIGTRLMDIKLGEAFSKNKINEHVKMSVESAKEFLSQFQLLDDVKGKIINCVEGHHGTTEWICKEAEICANADCYRFLLVRNWLDFLIFLESRDSKFEDHINLARMKAEEKWKILSIDICKKELEPHYHLIKDIISKSKNF